MAEVKNFRIILDLSRYYHDHRRKAKVFTKNLKTINDLQDHISSIFNITGFYLSTDGAFLPVSEDIRVLQTDEVVFVTPDNVTSAVLNSKGLLPQDGKIQNKQHKRILEDIQEESAGSSSPSRKKAKKHKENIDAPPCHSTSEDSNNEVKHEKNASNTKKKKKASADTVDNSNSQSPVKQPISKSNNTPQHLVENAVCNIEFANKVMEIKKKLKQKSNEFNKKYTNSTPKSLDVPNYKTILPKLKNCHKVGHSTTDNVRLSRHVDTPFKAFSKYTAPKTTTEEYLAKNKVNIVKIDLVRDNVLVDATPDRNEKNISQNINNEDSPPENIVKSLVSSFEKNISPENSKGDCDNIGMDDHNVSVPAQNSQESVTEHEATPVIMNSISSIDPITSPKDSSQTEVSFEIPSLPQDFPISSDVDPNTSAQSNNSLQKNKKSKIISAHSGLGLCLSSLRESDSLVSYESDTSSQNVTVRKRQRKRKRTKTKHQVSDTTSTTDTPILRPITTKACPKIHIKFDENKSNEEVIRISSSDVCQKDSYYTNEASSTIEMLVLSDENEDPVMENKNIFSSENISKAPLMKDKLTPKVGDLIAFKVLKIAADYSPQVSNDIIGRAEGYNAENKMVCFKILSGKEELLAPVGKLSLDLENGADQESQMRELAWDSLLEPKLLYP